MKSFITTIAIITISLVAATSFATQTAAQGSRGSKVTADASVSVSTHVKIKIHKIDDVLPDDGNLSQTTTTLADDGSIDKSCNCRKKTTTTTSTTTTTLPTKTCGCKKDTTTTTTLAPEPCNKCCKCKPKDCEKKKCPCDQNDDDDEDSTTTTIGNDDPYENPPKKNKKNDNYFAASVLTKTFFLKNESLNYLGVSAEYISKKSGMGVSFSTGFLLSDLQAINSSYYFELMGLYYIQMGSFGLKTGIGLGSYYIDMSFDETSYYYNSSGQLCSKTTWTDIKGNVTYITAYTELEWLISKKISISLFAQSNATLTDLGALTYGVSDALSSLEEGLPFNMGLKFNYLF